MLPSLALFAALRWLLLLLLQPQNRCDRVADLELALDAAQDGANKADGGGAGFGADGKAAGGAGAQRGAEAEAEAEVLRVSASVAEKRLAEMEKVRRLLLLLLLLLLSFAHARSPRLCLAAVPCYLTD